MKIKEQKKILKEENDFPDKRLMSLLGLQIAEICILKFARLSKVIEIYELTSGSNLGPQLALASQFEH